MNIVIPKANTHKASIVSEAEKAIADREAVEKVNSTGHIKKM